VTHIQELECAGWSTSSCISSLCVAEEHSGLQCCTVMAQHAGLLEHVESREVCDWLESLVSAMRRSVCSGWCARREVFLGLCNSPTLLQQPQPYVNIFACGEIPRLIGRWEFHIHCAAQMGALFRTPIATDAATCVMSLPLLLDTLLSGKPVLQPETSIDTVSSHAQSVFALQCGSDILHTGVLQSLKENACRSAACKTASCSGLMASWDCIFLE